MSHPQHLAQVTSAIPQGSILGPLLFWIQSLDTNSVGCTAFNLSKAFDALIHSLILSTLS